MPLGKLWPVFLVLCWSAVCLASIRGEMLGMRGRQEASLAAREKKVWKLAVRDSELAAVLHVTTYTSCATTRPPQALATPNPVLADPDTHVKVTVSFIIGTDGHVHSPLILESASPAEDRTVLKALHSWRYRPATCNGVPTEAEAKIEFYSR